ncbi:MAG: prolipoprotein diacylglyceryl transferase [Rhodospirillaceae bacterium]
MLLAIPFPQIDPVLVSFGPFAVRWYALAYIAGLVIGWRLMRRFGAAPDYGIDPEHVDDFLVWATLGVILGGRIGYVLFYNLPVYIDQPQRILYVWQGGMSFHGGFLGVVAAGYLFCRRRGIRPLVLGDLCARVAPVGLFFGRIANFINGELYGRVTDTPWGIVFPRGGADPRHPSQLYEAALEGVVLFILINLLARLPGVRQKPGFLTGVFVAGYAASRMLVELVRQPDAQIGFLSLGSTMGQWLSVPMLVVGLYMMVRARR